MLCSLTSIKTHFKKNRYSEIKSVLKIPTAIRDAGKSFDPEIKTEWPT